jgi:hypothetical protein
MKDMALQYTSHPVSSMCRALDCEPWRPWIIPVRRRSLLLWLIMKSFLRSFALYLCSDMYRSFSSLRKWRQLVLVNCLTACPGTMPWLNCALVNAMWLTVMILVWKLQASTLVVVHWSMTTWFWQGPPNFTGNWSVRPLEFSKWCKPHLGEWLFGRKTCSIIVV